MFLCPGQRLAPLPPQNSRASLTAMENANSLPPVPTADSGSAASPTSLGNVAREPRVGRRVAGVFVAVLLSILAGYVVFTVPGKLFTSANAVHYDARSLGIAAGKGALSGDALVVVPDASGSVIVSVTTSLRSTDFPGVEWQASELPAGAQARLLWRNDTAAGRLFALELPIEDGRLQPVIVSHDANWFGRITGLALSLKLPAPGPVRVQGVTAQTLSAGAVLTAQVSQWLSVEPWSASSINTVVGSADLPELPLPALLGLAAALTAAISLVLARWRPTWFGARLPAALAVTFLAAWFVLDARWQLNLARQVQATLDQYAGKTWREKHIASDDGPLFAFIEKVRATLPPPPARVFIFADSNYFRDRGAYHLYPYNVYFDPSVNTTVPTARLRQGDYVVVYQRRGVQYDPAQQRLRWDGSAPVTADLLLADAGAALFRIR